MPPFTQPSAISAKKVKLTTIIDDKVYDVTDFVNEHPGGPVILTQLGQDATDSFNAFHPPSIQEILSEYFDEELTKQHKSKKADDSDFLKEIRALKNQFVSEGIFESNLWFYLFIGLSNLSIFGLSAYLLSHHGDSYIALTISAVLLGLFWQQCGWHAHEYLHHQVFEDRELNNLIGGNFFGGLCQGFSTSWWKDKHNTHHATPNVHDADPDIDTHPFLAWSENAMELYSGLSDQELSSHFKKFMLGYQSYLFFPLLAFARLSWCFYSMWYALSNGQLGDKTKQYIQVKPLEPICLILHWVIYVTMSIIYPSSWLKTFYYILISQTSSGVLLASVFALNHNGMVVLTKEESSKKDFYTLQIETGRDVQPSYFMTWFTGGLNYQIEHHLFPTIPRHNFHKIQARVQAMCKKYDINYHCTGFIQGTIEVLDRLDRVSKIIEDGIHHEN